jgi:hypothetical protein
MFHKADFVRFHCKPSVKPLDQAPGVVVIHAVSCKQVASYQLGVGVGWGGGEGCGRILLFNGTVQPLMNHNERCIMSLHSFVPSHGFFTAFY